MPTEQDPWCTDKYLYFQMNDTSRIPILHRQIVKEVDRAGARNILDYGCGDGRLMESFSEFEKYNFTLFDSDPEILRLVAHKFMGKDNVLVRTDSSQLSEGGYDAVVSSNVLMLMKSIEELRLIVKQMRRLMASGGAVYVGITHPCFLDHKFATYSNDFTDRFKEFDYFANGADYKVHMTVGSVEIEIRDYFWNLSTIINQFIASEFRLKLMVELRDIQPNNFPPFLFLEFC
jgi:trans-aconitate methyltransferase